MGDVKQRRVFLDVQQLNACRVSFFIVLTAHSALLAAQATGSLWQWAASIQACVGTAFTQSVGTCG